MTTISTSKVILFLTLFFEISSTLLFGQNLPEKENDSIIVWSKSRKLTWSDFQKNPNNEKRGAKSDIGIDLLTISSDNDDSEYVVLTYFYKTHSHIKSTDSLILKHEQLHFDIAEVFARKLREKIKNLNKEFFDLESYNKEINLIYQRYFLYQERYDRETKHSLNIDKQNEWEEKINLNLLSSTSYTSEIYN